MDPRSLRKAAGWSQLRVAAATGVSQITVRLFEANPLAVSDRSAIRLEAFYARLRQDLQSKLATPRLQLVAGGRRG